MKNNLVTIVVVVVGALVLVGGGITAGILLSRKDSPASDTQETSKSQDTAITAPAETAEKTVAKTGACNSGEIKHLSAGEFIVGEDIASGEYIIKNDNKKDAPFVSLYVYPSKNSALTDEFNRTEVAIFDASETRTLKIDTGNYLKVVYGGLLTCQ